MRSDRESIAREKFYYINRWQKEIGPFEMEHTDCNRSDRNENSISQNNHSKNVNKVVSTGPEISTQLLLSRLTSAKKLVEFSGDPLDGLRFKQSHETSTDLGKYTDKENVSRLYDALKGKAREAVDALMLTASSSEIIMQTLELRFGDPENIIQKVIQDLKVLPKIQEGKIDLISFATKVRNGVAAIQALNHIGHLHSFNIISEIISKIPSTYLFGTTAHLLENRNHK